MRVSAWSADVCSSDLRAIFMDYALLCFGLLTVGNRVVAGSWPDYSYGMYIYAFPVMIGLRHWLDWETHFMLAAATALATFPLAAFSWHYVEKPVLDAFQLYRKRRRERLSPVRSAARSEEHTSELQSLMRISYAVFCL